MVGSKYSTSRLGPWLLCFREPLTYESYELNKSYLVSGFTVGIVGLSYIYIYIHIYRHFSGAKAAAVLAGKWTFTVKHIFRRELTCT